ncbi:pyridoxal-phosphate dependent enzyme [Porticoccaceae bacterium]|nr:pyridoxal-phosphate dependent enzyme [Porticoccaceae bacterium]
MTVTYNDIRQSHERIKPFIHRTPILTSRIINELVGAELYFKCENFQKGGAFKARGAFNAVHSLSEEQLAKGLVTHSSGNHAAALALACASRGAKATVVMPSNSPKPKKVAVAGYGATIVECEPTLAARETTANKILAETQGTFLHPYDNDQVIAGQGTAAKEMIEDGPAFDLVMCPVGGGGLLAGTAISVKELLPDAKVIAAEPLGADDAKRSFDAGKRILQTQPSTIADGLLTSLGERNFAIIQQSVDNILTAQEANIIRAMRLIWQHMKIVIEPSAALPLACLLEHKLDLKGKKVGIILSGGNVDIDKLPW